MPSTEIHIPRGHEEEVDTALESLDAIANPLYFG